MSDIAVRCENLSKKYRIGRSESYGTLRDVITSTVSAPLRRFRSSTQNGNGNNFIWALDDVSFEVKRGEVAGIIGRNGAGKSTLLKILSRITKPTKGMVEINGRVGSLLEVGTGFHPELTGRENIYLNGAILGMKRAEINRKFDEIVAFAEIEKFLDTPVKRYSSGMYMRLAFAVAAHLEPEILIVDEVLAVGDSQFQKKCLGKMGDVAKEGRTVLFVSHNMQAVTQLTTRCLVLNQGKREFDGTTHQAVRFYESIDTNGLTRSSRYQAAGENQSNHLLWARVHTSGELEEPHRWGEPIIFEFALKITEPQDSLCFSFQVVNELQQPVCQFWQFDSDAPFRRQPGIFRLRCEVPKFRLFMGSYTLTTWLADRRGHTLFENLTSICPFEVTMQGIHREEYEWMPRECMYIEDTVWSPIVREEDSLEKGELINSTL